MLNGRRLRIGVDFHVFDGKYQGSRSHLLGLYRELVAMCPEFDFVFFLDQVEGLRRTEGFARDNVSCIRMPRTNSLKRLAWDLPLLRWRHGIDILHTQYVMPLLPSRGRIVTIHDILFEEYPQYFGRFFVHRSRFMMRHAARNADAVFTVSDYSRDEIARRYGLEKTSIAVTPNAVDPQVFFPGEQGSEVVKSHGFLPQEYILTVGRIEPRKNHAGLIRAYSKLAGRPPPLVIVGQRDFGYDEFESAMQTLPDARQVVVISDVGDGDLAAWYRNALLFVYPSFAEGFGMPPLEALASGVPVITTNATAIPEVVGSAGILVAPGDELALREAMHDLLMDSARRKAMAQQGAARASSFSWAASARVMADRLLRLAMAVQ